MYGTSGIKFLTGFLMVLFGSIPVAASVKMCVVY